MSEKEEQQKIDKEESKRKRERRFQSFMLTLLTAACAWAGSTLVTLREFSASIKTHMESVDIQLASTYRADMAKRDVQETALRLDSIDAHNDKQDDRLDAINVRVTRLETDRHKAVK